MSRGLMRSAALGAPDLGLALSVSSLVALGGTPPLASVMLGVVLLAQTAIGERTMRRARWWGETGWHERLLLRVVVGAVVATTVDQLARVALGPGPLASCAWWAVAAAAVAVPGRAATEAGGAPEVVWREWIWLAMVACVLLAHEVLWTAETAVALALVGVAAAGAVGARRMPTPLRLVLVATGVAVAWWGIERRPSMRLLPDDRFFARVVWSLGEWGFTTNPSTYGEAFRYHWLSYAWIGLLGRASGATPADAVQTVGPVAVAVACGVGLVALARWMSQRTATAIPAAVLAAACSTYAVTARGRGFHIAWVESFSQFASIPVGIALLLLARRTWGSAGWGGAATLAVGVVVTTGVKVSTGFVAAGALAGAGLADLVRSTRPTARTQGVTIVGVLAAVGGTFAFSDPAVDETSRSGLVRPYWPVGSLGDLWRWYDDSLGKWIIVMTLLLSALGGATAIAAVHLAARRGHSSPGAISATILGGGCTAVLLTGLITSTEPWYGLQAITALAWLVLALGLAEASGRSPLWMSLAVGGIVGALTRWGDVERSDPDQILWIYVTRPAIPIVFAMLVMIVVASRPQWRRTAALHGGAVLVAASVVLAGSEWWRQQRADYGEWRRASVAATDADRVALYGWLDEDAPSGAVVASISDVLSSEVRLREAVASPTMGYPFPPYRAERLEALRAMYAVPDCAESRRQMARGVTLAVATEAEAALGALDACAARVYENASYVVYDLTNAP